MSLTLIKQSNGLSLIRPRRTKISHDPNNNTWSKSTTRFGEKVLQRQGWIPGSYLGPLDAPHAAFHTEANVSHIWVTAKDDNLGLGAKVGPQPADGLPTGLDSFQNLLGRLNGKTEAKLEAEQQGRDGVRRREYVNQRWGSLQFVSAGFLVRKNPITFETPVAKSYVNGIGATIKVKEEPQSIFGVKSAFISLENMVLEEEETKNHTKRLRSIEEAQRKLEREERRKLRRLRKIEKRPRQETLLMPEPPVVASKIMTPVPSSSSRNQQDQEQPGSRHTAVRKRYIRQKKMAMMDSKALNEVSLSPTRFLTYAG